MPERSGWADPRVIVAAIGVMVSGMFQLLTLAGVVIGIYVMSQTRSATSEMSNVQLGQQLTNLSLKVDKVTDIIVATQQENATRNAELAASVATLRRDLDKESEERKGRDGWLEARIISGK